MIENLSKEEFEKFLIAVNNAMGQDPYGPGINTSSRPPIDIPFRTQFTKEDILNFIGLQDYLLYDYVLYGTKKTIDLVRDQVPENCKICELPEEVMRDGLEDKLFLMKNEQLHKQYERFINNTDPLPFRIERIEI